MTAEKFNMAEAWALWGWEVGYGNVRKVEARPQTLGCYAKNVGCSLITAGGLKRC